MQFYPNCTDRYFGRLYVVKITDRMTPLFGLYFRPPFLLLLIEADTLDA
jgi:hypothetical protein